MKKKIVETSKPLGDQAKEKYALKGENGFRAPSTVSQLLKDLAK